MFQTILSNNLDCDSSELSYFYTLVDILTTVFLNTSSQSDFESQNASSQINLSLLTSTHPTQCVRDMGETNLDGTQLGPDGYMLPFWWEYSYNGMSFEII